MLPSSVPHEPSRVVRRTLVVTGSAAADSARIALARDHHHGTIVTSIEGLAARLAGGFLRGIDRDALHDAVADAVREMPASDLADLAAIAGLPGLPGALSATLAKAWSAGIDLASRARATGDERLASLACVEVAALDRLPSGMCRPADLVARAVERLRHAPGVLGEVEFHAVAEVDPCWRTLIMAVARTVPTRWAAGPRAVPDWVRSTAMTVEVNAAARPEVSVASCASARHEVMEAFRWARCHLAGGVAASDIAIAASAPGDYDDLVLSLAAEANIDVHFSHGRRALTTRDGQPCAALADLLLQGLDRDRMLRLARAIAGNGTSLGTLPEGWSRHLPRGLVLDKPERWRKGFAADEAPSDVSTPFLLAVDLIARGLDAAREIGDALLRGPSRLIWRRALMRAPPSAIEATLADLRVADGVEPATSIAWMHAAALASAPRPHVWLLGLNSRTWPRRSREDPLLPDHIVPGAELQPRTVTDDDRASFAHILLTAEKSVTCSYSRRDPTGRLLGVSSLLPKVPVRVLHRARVPQHALSEPDRLMACPDEFAASPRAASSDACWRDWRRPEITAHDGLVRADHPVLKAALARQHSASSLKALLRNPLGFVWKYGLGWGAPDADERPFALDAAAFGSLVHEVLQVAVRDLEAGAGLSRSGRSEVAAAVERAAVAVGAGWVEKGDLPPPLLWEGTLARARDTASAALCWPLQTLVGQSSFVEIDFPEGGAGAPWTVTGDVAIPGTGLRIGGRIDRLDLSGDGRRARVVDYKTGKAREPVALDGGRELQRCLYAFAVGALMGRDVSVEAALLYPHDEAKGYRALDDQAETLRILTAALAAAEASLIGGAALPGPDAGDDYDDLLFALPASPGSFMAEKRAAARGLLGAAADIWEQL